MMRYCTWVALAACLCLPHANATANGRAGEYVTTSPIVDDGVLYVASFDEPWRQGHLRAIDINGTIPNVLWDAAEKVPLPGTGSAPGVTSLSDPPSRIDRDNLYRSLFTNLGGLVVSLTAAEAGRLQGALGMTTEGLAAQLLHTLRGRMGTSSQKPAGNLDAPCRLGAFSRSSPRLVGRSPATRAERDRVIYLGAEDGLLHAFLAARWNDDGGAYLVDDPLGGTELWGYLPGSFLPHLKDQPQPASSAVSRLHVDGSPVAVEAFVALSADGRRHWRTLLAATGTIAASRQSCLFVFDVSDPYRPVLLWECLLPGDGMGRSRGVTLTPGGRGRQPILYLTADFSDEKGGSGVQAGALDALTGELLWQFSAAYDELSPVENATPAVPVLMDRTGDGVDDTLLFGDMAGRLWALDLGNGQPLGDAPAFVVPAGAAEPIGAGVAVRGRVAVFGTGGVEHADDNGNYAVYAVEILPDGGRLLWSYPLAPGEQVWDTPSFDAAGNLYFATAVDYLPQDPPTHSTAGRVVSLDRTGTELLSRSTGEATVGRVFTAPGLAVSVALTGEVTQLGSAGRTDVATPAGPGPVRLLSWRQR